jgi:hypothetical protein
MKQVRQASGQHEKKIARLCYGKYVRAYACRIRNLCACMRAGDIMDEGHTQDDAKAKM